MPKRKLDLRQLGTNQLAKWPQRRARLSELRRLGAAALQARSARLRAEHFMVALAFLMLLLAIVLSSVSAPTATQVPTASIIAMIPTFSRTPGVVGTTSGTPSTQASSTRVLIGTPTTVSMGTLVAQSAYPGPENAPVGIGTPLPGVVGTALAGAPQPPTPQVIPTIPAITGNLPPGTTGGGYPAPNNGRPAGGAPYPGANAPPPNVLPPTLPPRVTPSSGGFPSALPPPPRGFTPIPTKQLPSLPRPTSAPPLPTPASSTSGYPGPTPVALVPTSPSTGGQTRTSTVPQPQPTRARTGGVPPTAASIPTPTEIPTVVAPPPTATPVPPPTATEIPVTVLSGNVHWTVDQSPIILGRNTLVDPSATVQIDPGVEVQLASGVQLAVAGTLQAQGTTTTPVRFTGPQGRWAGIFGQPGSSITLTNTELHQSGQGGVALSANGGTLHVYNSLITDGGGGISTTGATVDVEHTRIMGNDLPSAPAVLLSLSANQAATLVSNIVGGNQLSTGTPQVKLQVDANGSGPLRIENNLITATNGVGLDLTTAAPLGGTVRCNGFVGGTTGVAINATTPSNTGFALVLDTNSFTGQVNYGASSTVGLNVANNWWGDSTGPYDALRNPQGKGERVGVNLQFQPWLPAHPACAPTP